MSLLLEALKKAELAKQSANAPAIEPAIEPVITRDTLPDISSALQIEPPDLPSPAPASPSVFDTPEPVVDLPDSPPEPPAPPPMSSEPAPARPRATSGEEAAPRATDSRGEVNMEANRAAARQMFEAKEVDYNPKRPFYITLGVLGLCAAGYGGYLWWELQPRSIYNAAAAKKPAPPAPDTAAGNPVPPPANNPPAQADNGGSPPAAAQPTSPTAAPAAQPQAQAAAVQPAAGGTQPGAGAPPPSKPPANPANPVGARAGASGAASPVASAPAAQPAAATPAARPRPAAPPRSAEQRAGSAIAVTPATPGVDAQIERAYEAFQKGDLATSRSLYQSSLQRDPVNRDALLGLAAIDMRMRNFDLAEARYLKLLEADPRDTHAVAGLIALRGQTDPVQSESRLKTLIAQQPDAAHLHFALGNQLAAQSRWPEAQQSYFKAFSLDSDNPDFAFNLAVSLDHMRQGKLALEYYRRSVSLSTTRAASFDRNRVNNRIAELSR